MTIASEIKRGAKIAVFARNHPQWLRQAAKINSARHARKVTFRSSRAWTSAKIALDERRPIPVYFVPTSGGNVVAYVAALHEVQLKPTLQDPRTQLLLRKCPPGTQKEGLWKESVKTLYVVSACRRLDRPFSQTMLTKVADGQTIDPGYIRSYCIVYELPSIPDDGILYPDEEDNSTLSEGAMKQVPANRYERNPEAREKCIAHYGWNCSVCNMNFEQAYGALGHEFIHVHHLHPLALKSQKQGKHKVDPIKDLRPVCPNCHAMLHKGKKLLSIAALQKRLLGA